MRSIIRTEGACGHINQLVTDGLRTDGLRTNTPWPASDVCSPPREAGLRKMLCQELSKAGSADRHPWRRTRHFSLSGIPMAHDRSVSMRWTTPRRRHGNASAWPKLKSHFRHCIFSCQSISSGTMWEKSSSPQAFCRTRPRFSLGSGLAISDTGRYRPHSGRHVVNPELGGGVRLRATSRGILRRAKAIRKGADRTVTLSTN
jgi:hypothetical protein